MGISREVYEASVSDSLSTKNSVPRWWLMMEDDEILGGFGQIENGFMVRRDLVPWLCALYAEEGERGRGLGARLLVHGLREAAKLGFAKAYLSTGHTGYYERHGWRFIGMSGSVFGGETRVCEAECRNWILETPRLLLRDMTLDDYPYLAAILQDEKTMEAYEGAFGDIETHAWLARNLERCRIEGMGLRAVILKENGALIGLAGLTSQRLNGKTVPEVGYMFNRAWGATDTRRRRLRPAGGTLLKYWDLMRCTR